MGIDLVKMDIEAHDVFLAELAAYEPIYIYRPFLDTLLSCYVGIVRAL